MGKDGEDEVCERKASNLWEGEDERIEKAKSTLIDHYSTQQTSQGTRLIGFVASLFVLLQVTQTGIGKELANVFPNFPTIPLVENVPLVVWDSLKVIFLFLGASVILFYILRTIFRYSVFGIASSEVMWVTKDEARTIAYKFAKHRNQDVKEFEFRELWVLHRATFDKVYTRKIYWKIPANWFSPKACPERESHVKRGFVFCAVLASAVALMLLVFLW